jgi:hypothetical protein
VKELLQSDKSFVWSILSEQDGTAMHLACRLGHGAVVRELLSADANLNVTKSDGATPLMGAVTGGHHQLVRTLLRGSADVNMATNDGSTALSIARKLRHSDNSMNRQKVVQLLEKATASSDGNSGIDPAVGNGSSADVAAPTVPGSAVVRVAVSKDSAGGLGLSFKNDGAHNVVIRVKPGSPAHSCGKIAPGMRILAVNGTRCATLSKAECTALFKASDDLELVLESVTVADAEPLYGEGDTQEQPGAAAVAEHRSSPKKRSSKKKKKKGSGSDEAKPAATGSIKLPKEVVTIAVPKDAGLGLKFVASKTSEDAAAAKGAYITGIVPGGAAAGTGKLRSGQRIIKVNGTSVNRWTRKAIVDLISAIPTASDGGKSVALTIRDDMEGFAAAYPEAHAKAS